MKTMIIAYAVCSFCLTAAFAPARKTHFFDRTSVNITESEKTYELTAEYPEKRTASVQQCLSEYLKQNKATSFNPAEMDATITFDDKSTFYARSFPGKLELKFDKRKNSHEALVKFKKLCGKLKAVIGG